MDLDGAHDLDVRAARGIVAQRPFADLEQLDTVSFVVASAFGKLVDHIQSNNLLDACGDATLHVPIEACDDGNLADGDGCPKTCFVLLNVSLLQHRTRWFHLS